MGLNSSLGERIAQIRKEHGYSQKALSELIDGFNRDHIVKLENNKVTNPKRELLAQIVKILHTTYEWLETGKGIKDTRKESVSSKPDQIRDVENEYILSLIDLLEKSPMEETANILRDEVRRIINALADQKLQTEKYRSELIKALEKIRSLRS